MTSSPRQGEQPFDPAAIDTVRSEGALPGSLLAVEGDTLAVAAGGDTVAGLVRVQRPGRNPVSGAELQRAEALVPGRREFGSLRPEETAPSS